MTTDAARPSLLATLSVQANQGYTEIDGPRCYQQFPAQVCLPLPEGVCAADELIELRHTDGRVIPATARAFLYWPDGSVRAWDVQFPLDLARGEKILLELHRATQATPPAPIAQVRPVNAVVAMTFANGKTISETVDLSSDDTFTLTTDALRFEGAIVCQSWDWFDGSSWAVRLTNHCDDEVVDVAAVRITFDLPGSGATHHCVRQTAFTASGHPRLAERDNPIRIKAGAGGVRVEDEMQIGEDENNYPPYERGGYVLSVAPWMGVRDDDAAWVLVLPDAAERMPKAWAADDHHITIDLHPHDDEALQWRQGMTLFQRAILARLPKDSDAAAMENAAQAWLRPPLVTLDAEVYRAAGWRIPFRYDPARFPRTEFGYRQSFNFSWTAGTFNWGDQLAGGKGGGHIAPGSKAVARNLEYDFPAVAAKEFARTGVHHLRKHCIASAEHMMYTDFVAYSTDPWKHGGIVHHSYDHTSGSAYPSHMWAEGLTLYHQLTADPYALEVAQRVGDFYLKYINERFVAVQATAREVGWSLIALAAIYDLTRKEKYLEGIRRLVDYNIDAGWRSFFPTDACFTIGVAIIGFDRTRGLYRDDDTTRFIIDLLDWMMDERRDAIGLFEYWLDPELGAIPYVQTHLPEALNIGYLLTSDEKYLLAAYRLYQVHQHGGMLTVQNPFSPPECGFAAGNHISWMGCLQSFAEKGWLDALQYPSPG